MLVRLPPDRLRLPPELRGYDANGIVAYSKICTHAGCAISLYRAPLFQPDEPRPALVCPCHYSTFDPSDGGSVTSVRPDAACRCSRCRPTGMDICAPPATSTARSGRRGGASGSGSRNRDPPPRPLRRHTHGHARRSCARRCAISSPTTGRSCSARSRSTRSSCSSRRASTSRSSSSDSTRDVVYHGPTRRLHGQHMSEAYRSVLDISTDREGRPAHPPDASLGGERLRRRDRAPPAARVLHRRVPQAARAHVSDRRDDAHAHPARGLHGLFARRRPALRDGSRDRLLGRPVDSVRRREPHVAGSFTAPSPARARSGRACTSHTS